MNEQLVSEPIRPLLFESSPEPFAAGDPTLPRRFAWRGEEHLVTEVLERWKEYSPGSAAMPDRYLRRHWYRIRTAAGHEMKIYFERKARSKGAEKERWWLFSVLAPE